MTSLNSLLIHEVQELINEDLMELQIRRKDRESPKESSSSTGELERFMTQEMARGILYEEALLVFE